MINSNPIWTSATIAAVISAAITLLVAFGVKLTGEQITAILGFVGVVAPIAVAIVANPKTTPLAAPTDEDGSPLVRRADGQPTHAATRAMAKR